jgi:RNA polymerase-binding transcription factor DksA
MDAADVAAHNDERAMARVEDKLRARRIAESHRPFNPKRKRRCMDCHQVIAKARLKVQPCASRCIDCADALERNGFV